jgi:two-component sensor histidine kinase
MTANLKHLRERSSDELLLDMPVPDEATSARSHMRESDHRIKNHLQLISSSLAIQARGAAHAEARELLMQAYGRVSAVARLHERFQATVGLQNIQIADFLNEVCADLAICFNAAGSSAVELEVDVESRAMPAGDALTLGLIVNELVTNAVKHGSRDAGQMIRISLHREENPQRDEKKWRLTVHDNGPGMDPDTFGVGSGLGARLLHAMAAQIRGYLRVDPVAKGASVSVVFE